MTDKQGALGNDPSPEMVEALAAAAQNTIESFLAGKLSHAEMVRRFWRCISQIPPVPRDVSVPLAGSRAKEWADEEPARGGSGGA